MNRIILGILVATAAASAAKPTDTQARVTAAATAFKEIMATEDKGIPKDLLAKAECVVMIPGMKKGGFILGGQYGKGYMTCRTTSGWSGVSTVKMEGGSFGLQIGGGEVDVIMVVMNKVGAEKLMRSEFTLGGDVGAMAGPVGRDSQANTDAMMRAEILSYSRARGAFAGITLNGSTLRSDDKDNAEIYGKKVTHKEILTGQVPAASVGKPLIAVLQPYVMGARAR